MNVKTKTLYIPTNDSMADRLFDYDSAYINACKRQLRIKQTLLHDYLDIWPAVLPQAADLASFLGQLTIDELKRVYKTYDVKLPRVQRKANYVAELVDIVKQELQLALAKGGQELYDFFFLFASQPVRTDRELGDYAGTLQYALAFGMVFCLADAAGTSFSCPADLVSLVEKSYAAADKLELKKRTELALMTNKLLEITGVMTLRSLLSYLCQLISYYEKGQLQKKVDPELDMIGKDKDLFEQAVELYTGFIYHSNSLDWINLKAQDEILVHHNYVLDAISLYAWQEHFDDLSYPALSCQDLLQSQTFNSRLLADFSQELAQAGILAETDKASLAWTWLLIEQNDLVERDFFAAFVASLAFADQREANSFRQMLSKLQTRIRLWRLKGRSARDMWSRAEDLLLADDDLAKNMINLPTQLFDQLGIRPEDLAKIRETIVEEASGPSKVGRNDPCPCGSGKKYKQCCGAK